MDENEIVSKAKQGDRVAIELLYRSHFLYIYKYVKSMLNDVHIVEDVVSEIFYKALKNLDKFRADCSFKTWLHTIAKNEIFSQIKKNINNRAKFVVSEEYFEEIASKEVWQESNVNEETEIEELKKDEIKAEKVGEILSKMRPNYAEILRMRFIMNLNIKECANVLGITENNVKVLQNRALKHAYGIGIELTDVSINTGL